MLNLISCFKCHPMSGERCPPGPTARRLAPDGGQSDDARCLRRFAVVEERLGRLEGRAEEVRRQGLYSCVSILDFSSTSNLRPVCS
jgi:hypothetical protein